MRITAVRWDEWSEDHIAAHRVGTAEVEGVLFDRASKQRTGREGTSRYTAEPMPDVAS